MGKPPGWKTSALHHSLLKIANHLLQQDIIALPALSWDIQEEPEKAEKEYLESKARAAFTAATVPSLSSTARPDPQPMRPTAKLLSSNTILRPRKLHRPAHCVRMLYFCAPASRG
eukprot:3940147-Rhodomonas_salina.1